MEINSIKNVMADGRLVNTTSGVDETTSRNSKVDPNDINQVPENTFKMVLTKGQLEILNDHRDITDEFYIDGKGVVYAVCSDGLVKTVRDNSIDFLDEATDYDAYYRKKIVLNLISPKEKASSILVSGLQIAVKTMDRLCYELFDQGFTANDLHFESDEIIKDIVSRGLDEVVIKYMYQYEDGKTFTIGEIIYVPDNYNYAFLELSPEIQNILIEYAINSTYGEFNAR